MSTSAVRQHVSTAEVVVWFVVVAITTLLVHPLLGIVVALAVGFTRLRDSGWIRVWLLLFALALTAVVLFGVFGGGSMTGGVGTPVRVN